MAQDTTWQAPEEGDLVDVHETVPPPLEPDEVWHNDRARPAIFEQEVVLDSGATDCMVPSMDYLTMVSSTHHLVTIANGKTQEGHYKGLS